MKVKGMDVDLDGANWVKSSRSGAAGHCVEVAFLENNGVGVRDSKDPSGPALVFTPAEWDAFMGGAKDGEFDRG
jgi:hypothetical protein